MHFTSQVCPPLPLAADSSPSTAAQTALLTVKFPAVPRREIMSSYPELSEPAQPQQATLRASRHVKTSQTSHDQSNGAYFKERHIIISSTQLTHKAQLTYNYKELSTTHDQKTTYLHNYHLLFVTLPGITYVRESKQNCRLRLWAGGKHKTSRSALIMLDKLNDRISRAEI